MSRSRSGTDNREMDAVERLNEHFLSCSICTDIFMDPCTLGCGHSFCRGCLAQFTQTQQDAVRAKSILCPYCRQMTKVPKPSKPVEEWPKQFKPHFLIQGLLDEFADSGDSAQAGAVSPTDRLCFPCQQIGKTVQAGHTCQDCDVTLCEDCVKIHQTMPVTSHHAISHVQGDTKAVKGIRKDICQEHNRSLELCCRDCSKVICRSCFASHKKCRSVVRIGSMVEEMRSMVEDNRDSIALAVEEVQTNLAVQLSVMETIGPNKTSVQSEIRRVTQQVMDLIKQKEKQLMDELDELTEKQIEQLKGQIKSGEIDLQMYQQYSEFIDQALRSDSQVDLYDVYQMCQSGAVKCALDREKVSDSSSVGSISFVHKMESRSFQRKFEFGRLEVVQNEPKPTKTPTLQNTINIRTSSDTADPSASDVTVLDVEGVETVVITDSTNHCLKSFYTRSSQARCSTLSLGHEPHTVTKLKHNRVGVSFSSHNKILIVQVTPALVHHNTIVSHKVYRCLTALNQRTLAAGCWNPSSIDILDMSGKVQKSVTALNPEQNLIRYPEVLCTTNKGHILVSDYGSQSVYCLTQEGEAVFTYSMAGDRSLGGPRGITTTRSGDILVVDFEKKKVIQLTERGEYTRDVLTSQEGLDRPRAICLHHDKLYVTDVFQAAFKVFSPL